MKEIEIHCPIHGVTEKLELPDGYFNFEGEVRCASPVGNSGLGGELRIRLEGDEVKMVERASSARG